MLIFAESVHLPIYILIFPLQPMEHYRSVGVLKLVREKEKLLSVMHYMAS